MNQQQFEQLHDGEWQAFAVMLEQLEKMRRTRISPGADFPARYRALCGQYAMARQRRYSSSLVLQLHDWVLRAHRQLYRHRGHWLWRFARFFLYDFPGAVRRQAAVFWLASALFWLPGITMGLAAFFSPETIYMVLEPEMVARMEFMYDPANAELGRSEERMADSDFAMFGFYILNNVSIGFRAFAGGILLGLGSVFILLFNGLTIGGIAGFLTWRGFADTFWTFVAGHGAFELTAICISGAAGLLLAKALFAPGRYRRIEALRVAAGEAVILMMGAMMMLFMAAFIEAYWSSIKSLPAIVKYGVGGGLWVLLIAYLGFMGRGRHGAE